MPFETSQQQPKSEALLSAYRNPLAGFGYDVLVTAVFFLVGGISRLRKNALNELAVCNQTRVLELGCGTGGFTAHLAQCGASITAVDGSEPMLKRARKRVKNVYFEQAEITTYSSEKEFDLVVFSFVLHELSKGNRRKALQCAREVMALGARLVIIDHGIPKKGFLAKCVCAIVNGFEPSTNKEWIEGGFQSDLAVSGFKLEQKKSVGQGTAMVLVAILQNEQ